MTQQLTVPARPFPFELGPTRTAVIVVDMQNDFGSPGGMFERAGVDISSIQAIVPNVAAVLSAARGASIPVVYLKMAFKPDLSDAGFPSAPNWLRHAHFHPGDEGTDPNGQPSRILIRDTWNTEIVDELAPRESDPIVYKSRFSGFYQTEVGDLLNASGIERLIVVRAPTSVCVDS